jgi:hypothetical protein
MTHQTKHSLGESLQLVESGTHLSPRAGQPGEHSGDLGALSGKLCVRLDESCGVGLAERCHRRGPAEPFELGRCQHPTSIEQMFVARQASVVVPQLWNFPL